MVNSVERFWDSLLLLDDKVEALLDLSLRERAEAERAEARSASGETSVAVAKVDAHRNRVQRDWTAGMILLT